MASPSSERVNISKKKTIKKQKIALEKTKVQSFTIKTTNFPSINRSQYFAVRYFQCSTGGKRLPVQLLWIGKSGFIGDTYMM